MMGTRAVSIYYGLIGRVEGGTSTGLLMHSLSSFFLIFNLSCLNSSFSDPLFAIYTFSFSSSRPDSGSSFSSYCYCECGSVWLGFFILGLVGRGDWLIKILWCLEVNSFLDSSPYNGIFFEWATWLIISGFIPEMTSSGAGLLLWGLLGGICLGCNLYLFKNIC